MIGLDAAARPSCVIGASVWVSVVDKSACPNWAVLNFFRCAVPPFPSAFFDTAISSKNKN